MRRGLGAKLIDRKVSCPGAINDKLITVAWTRLKLIPSSSLRLLAKYREEEGQFPRGVRKEAISYVDLLGYGPSLLFGPSERR